MTIKVSKPAINIREELADLKQDTGLKGQELMRADTLAEARTAIGAGRKNLFINGGFDIWQRGTSLAAGVSYLADRWYNATTETQTRQTFTVGQTDVPHNPTYYHRGAGGSTEWYGLKQKVENVGITAGREVTLSYWAKGSSAFTNAPFRGQNFGSGGSSEVNAALSTASITTSWARYTHTFTLPSISGMTVGAGSYMQLNVIRASVNNVTIDLANCQLEFGSVATDFEQRSFGEELALCQRYYWQGGLSNSGVSYRWAGDTADRYDLGSVTFPTVMRVDPALSIVSAPTYADCAHFDLVTYNVFSGFSHQVTPTSSGTKFRGFGGVYSADAEL